MPEKFEKLKADFIEKNTALLHAIKQTNSVTFCLASNKLLLSTLRMHAVESYQNLLGWVETFPDCD